MSDRTPIRTYKFTDALGISKAIMYDLTAKRLQFTFQSKPDNNRMVFTATKDADTIKHLFPEFEILLDVHKNRYAEFVISYTLTDSYMAGVEGGM